MKKNAANNNETREKILALIDSEYDSDADFERRMGLAPKTVNNWRRGRSSSYMKMLPALAEGFEISVGELLDMPINRNSAELSEDEMNLLTLYRKSGILSLKQRMALSRTLEEIIHLYIDSYAEGKSAPKKKSTKQ